MSFSVTPSTLETLRNFARAGLIPAPDVEAIIRHFSSAAEPAAEALLTPKSVAQRYSCCTKTVYRLADEGRLQRVYLRPGVRKTLRFRLSDVVCVFEAAVPTATAATDGGASAPAAAGRRAEA